MCIIQDERECDFECLSTSPLALRLEKAKKSNLQIKLPKSFFFIQTSENVFSAANTEEEKAERQIMGRETCDAMFEAAKSETKRKNLSGCLQYYHQFIFSSGSRLGLNQFNL